MFDFKFIWSLLSWALSIGVAGGLVDMTIEMSHKAWHADHVGIVSMRSLTRQLMYPDTTIEELKGNIAQEENALIDEMKNSGLALQDRGAEVRAAFIARHAQAEEAFTPGLAGKWMADIFLLQLHEQVA